MIKAQFILFSMIVCAALSIFLIGVITGIGIKELNIQEDCDTTLSVRLKEEDYMCFHWKTYQKSWIELQKQKGGIS